MMSPEDGKRDCVTVSQDQGQRHGFGRRRRRRKKRKKKKTTSYSSVSLCQAAGEQDKNAICHTATTTDRSRGGRIPISAYEMKK